MAALFVFEDNMPTTRPMGGGDEDDKPGLKWHVGEPLPKPQLRWGQPMPRVLEVQADGDELDHIRRCIRNLPNPTGVRSVRWFGDMAMLIYYNIPWMPLGEG